MKPIYCTLDSDTFIEIAGPDATTFLQGQFTCDVKMVSATQTLLGAHCNLKGRLHYFFRLFFWQEAYYLKIPKDIAEHAITTLKKYALFSKVSIQQKEDLLMGIGVAYLDNVTAKQCGVTLPTQTHTATYTMDWIAVQVPGEQRFEIYGKRAAVSLFLQKVSDTFTKTMTSQWRCLEIQQRLPNVYQDTVEHWLPHPLRLPALEAVSFNKGCYLGQEIIARTQYLGQVKKHTQCLIFSTVQDIPRKTPILNAQSESVGEVVDAASDGKDTYILAVISDEALAEPLYCLGGAVTVK